MIVLDCSIIIASILKDEHSDYADRIMDLLEEDKEIAIVPSIFYLEASNVLLSAYRRKRLSKKEWQDLLNAISLLPFEVDHVASESINLINLSEIATANSLTSYDAAYLELAKRKHIKLASLDKSLKKAAEKQDLFFKV